jgi:prepilin-type N-terminal cleavage/methylation domain-containing protein
MKSDRTISRSTQRHRSGFSLMELLIVLAVLITITSIAAPNLMERVRSGRVQEAGEHIRELLGNARRYAVDSGVDYHVRFEVNGHSVIAIPAEPEAQMANSSGQSTTETVLQLESVTLDETLFLRSRKDENPGGEQLEPMVFSTLENAGALGQMTWSSPIVFRADGSADDRTFRVMDEESRSAEITVRGLTGSVRVSPVFIMEDDL